MLQTDVIVLTYQGYDYDIDDDIAAGVTVCPWWFLQAEYKRWKRFPQSPRPTHAETNIEHIQGGVHAKSVSVVYWHCQKLGRQIVSR
jgi:hypothetical protein